MSTIRHVDLIKIKNNTIYTENTYDDNLLPTIVAGSTRKLVIIISVSSRQGRT